MDWIQRVKNLLILSFTLLACAALASFALQVRAAGPAPALVFDRDIVMPGVPLGPYSDHLAVDLKGHRLFATPQATKSVQILDLKTGELIQSLTGMGNPHSILYRQDRNLIYVADGGQGLLKIYSGSDYHLLQSIKLLLDADSIAFDPATALLYVTNGGEGANLPTATVSVIDTNNNQHTADIPIPTNVVEAMALDPASRRLYINMTGTNSIGVIDRSLHKLTATWPITKARKNMAIALDSPHQRLFVGCRNSETAGVIVIFDTTSGKEIDTLPITGWVDYMAFDSRTGRLYASCGAANGLAYAFQQDSPNKYHLLTAVPTAPMAKTALLVPQLNQFLVSVPHKDPAEISRVMVFKTN